jgi:hypothetical protein
MTEKILSWRHTGFNVHSRVYFLSFMTMGGGKFGAMDAYSVGTAENESAFLLGHSPESEK